MKLSILPRLSIGGVTPSASDVRIFEANGDDVVAGAVMVGDRWYRIEDGILDLLPDALAVGEVRRRFAECHGLPWSAANEAERADDRSKVDQREFFKTDAPVYDDEVSNRSFYVASDRICFGDWMRGLPQGGAVCDIGAGTGRVSLPLALKGHDVLATDISEEMMRIARRRAIDAGVADRMTCVLADAERLPLVDNQFAAAVCYGALHHVPNPGAIVAEAGRILTPGGHWLSYDPHRSKVRFLFEWAMQLVTLYEELASDNPLLSKDDVEKWCKAAGLSSSVKLHFFLPPHVLAPLPPGMVESCLRGSDALFNAIGLGSFAGVIAVRGRKPAASR